MKITAAVITAAAICFALVYRLTAVPLTLTLAITFGTTAYHLDMRLLVGLLYNIFMRNRANYHRAWYRVKPWEERLYARLRVKKWKKRLPTFTPEVFDPRLCSWDEIAQAMCQAELVHETIFVLSFAPLFCIEPFGAPAVFILTSILSALFDLSFVIIQRSNRPRVVRLAERRRGNDQA